MRMLWLLLLFAYGISSICCSIPGCSTDKIPLLDFKRAVTNDPTQVFRSWNTSIPHCQWEGVNCSKTHPGRVTMLNLGGLGLSGIISPSLGNLTFLKALNLARNSFSGELPPLNRLRGLQNLTLSANSLQGTIREAIANCSNLIVLDLSSNMLTGKIPPKIGSLSKLKYFYLCENNFTGTIPLALVNATKLERIIIQTNQLTGGIPYQLWQLPNIVALLLSENMLSGDIFPALSNRSSLRLLDLNSNMLGKALPTNIGNALPSLLGLDLHNNMFEGQLPVSLGNASRLEILDLSYNSFTGQVPSLFGMLPQLSFLNLQRNKLQTKDQSWEFLDALTNCSLLQSLTLSENHLQGSIPNSVGNLSTKLERLALDRNNLSGIVPSSIANLSGLTFLILSNNSLTGPIGEWIGEMKSLQGLILEANNFIGLIPSSVGNLTRLVALSLAKNKFEGPIPPTLGSLSQLSELYLNNNNLEGNMPSQLSSTLTKYSISYNSLDGPIPSGISKLIQLSELRLSSNKLSGEIPKSLGECQQLQIVQMDQNFLMGNIPNTFSNLIILSVLNLSHNSLSGSIPTSLSDLQLLAHLDLSHNNLYGVIPKNGVFVNGSAVSLSDNWGLCGGLLDLRMPLCPSVSRGRVIQYYLVRTLIPIFGLMSLILLIYLLLTKKKKARVTQLSSPSFGEQFLKVSYKDLTQATQGFSESNMIGRGSYGTVYRAKIMETRLEVAVKVLDLDMQGAKKSFFTECEALRTIQHRNLVPIITACSTVDSKANDFKALVYEFMPNGDLDTWLHKKRNGKAPKHLSLTHRINIAVSIADALDYVHNDSGRPIVHCDVKPSNILLDDDMNAHLGDFGIASFYLDSRLTASDSTSSVGIKGTTGYIAPEYAGGGRVSTSGDVYSFGMVLLEMFSGKRPTDPMFENGLDLVNYVVRSFPEQILDIIDTSLQEECKAIIQAKPETNAAAHQCFCSVLQVALSCTQRLPGERMNMREVAAKMRAIRISSLKEQLIYEL